MYLSKSNNKVAEKFQMGRKKLMYVVNYGLFPYFKQILKSPLIVALFHESLSKTSQKSEMDLHVRYWDVNEKRLLYDIGTQFFGSYMLQRSK